MTLKDEPPRSVGVQYDLVYARKLSLPLAPKLEQMKELLLLLLSHFSHVRLFATP